MQIEGFRPVLILHPDQILSIEFGTSLVSSNTHTNPKLIIYCFDFLNGLKKNVIKKKTL